MATITATINYETRLCWSSIVAWCTPGQFFFAEEAWSCGACKKCQCDFFSLTDNPTCPTWLGPFLMVVWTWCLSRNYLSIPDFIDILDVEDKLVAIDASNTARYLFEQLEWCKNSAWADLLSISKSGAAPSQKIKFCINPANFEIKLTDLKDWPWSYADCTEFDWVYHSNQCSACSDDKCFKWVLTSWCWGNWWNRTCPVALFHAQIWTEQWYQEFELPHETEWW
jgi:hypothetical protein